MGKFDIRPSPTVRNMRYKIVLPANGTVKID